MTPPHLCHDEADPARATLDHVIPKSALRGAKVSMGTENLVYACQQCNQAKADTMPPAGHRAGNWEVTSDGNLMWIGGSGTLVDLDSVETSA